MKLLFDLYDIHGAKERATLCDGCLKIVSEANVDSHKKACRGGSEYAKFDENTDLKDMQHRFKSFTNPQGNPKFIHYNLSHSQKYELMGGCFITYDIETLNEAKSVDETHLKMFSYALHISSRLKDLPSWTIYRSDGAPETTTLEAFIKDVPNGLFSHLYKEDYEYMRFILESSRDDYSIGNFFLKTKKFFFSRASNSKNQRIKEPPHFKLFLNYCRYFFHCICVSECLMEAEIRIYVSMIQCYQNEYEKQYLYPDESQRQRVLTDWKTNNKPCCICNLPFKNFKDGQYDHDGKMHILGKCFNMFGRPILMQKQQKKKEVEAHNKIVNKEVDDAHHSSNNLSHMLGKFERMVIIEKFFTLLLNYLNLTCSINSGKLKESMKSSPFNKLAILAESKENIVMINSELATLYSWIQFKANLAIMPGNCLELLLALGDIRDQITVLKKGTKEEMDLAREQQLRKWM